MTVKRLRLSGNQKVRSLNWDGNRLVDVVGGEASVDLDGVVTPHRINWSFPFDRSLISPVSRTRLIFTTTGTKAVVTDGRTTRRELNRSYYWAQAYEYPLAVTRLSDGREVIAHCPDAYNRITIEVLDTGERLVSASEKSLDIFHSRLSFSPDGKYLLSAGWIWHPLGVAAVYDVGLALEDASHLAGRGLIPWSAIDADVEAACWLAQSTVLISGNPEEEALDDEGQGLRPGELGAWSLDDSAWLFRRTFPGHTGTLHPIEGRVLCLYDHPRLIDPSSATVIDEWPELKTGTQTSSITLGKEIPPVAIDDQNRRFAVATGADITVIELD